MKKIKVILSILGVSAFFLTACGSSVVESTTESTVVEEHEQETASVTEKDDETVTEEVVDENIHETEETAQEEIIPQNPISAYEMYMHMGKEANIKAIVDENVELGYGDFDAEYVGKELGFDELTQAMASMRLMESTTMPTPYFAFLGSGNDTTLVLMYEGMGVDGADDDSTTLLFLRYEDEKLHITHSVSSWSRQTVYLYEGGYLYTTGSAGAGEQISDAGIIGHDGRYHELYKLHDYTGDWVRDSSMVDTSIFLEAYDATNVDSIDCNLWVNEYEFSDETLITFVAGEGGMTESDKRFMDMVKDSGVIWQTSDEINAKIESVTAKSGGSYETEDRTPVVWTRVHSDENMIVPMRSSQWTSDWNHNDMIGRECALSEAQLQKIQNVATVDMDDSMIGELAGLMDYNRTSEEEFFFIKHDDSGSFGLYGTNHLESFIKTPDNNYVYIDDMLCDLLYCNTPVMLCNDYDGDGEDELYVKIFVFHGTGFIQESVIMIDKTNTWEGSEWRAYHLTPANYIDMLKDQYEVVDNGSEMIAVLKGDQLEPVSKEGDEEFMELYMDQVVYIEQEEKDIVITTIPTLFSEQHMIGLELEGLKLNVKYAGDGIWEAANLQ